MKLIPDWETKPLTCSVCGETRSVKYENEDGDCMCNLCALMAIDRESLAQKGKQQTIGKGSHVRLIDNSKYHNACGYVTDSFFDVNDEGVYMIEFDEPIKGFGMFPKSVLEIMSIDR